MVPGQVQYAINIFNTARFMGGYKDEEVFDEPTVKFGVGESMKFLRFMKSPIFSGFVIQQGEFWEMFY